MCFCRVRSNIARHSSRLNSKDHGCLWKLSRSPLLVRTVAQANVSQHKYLAAQLEGAGTGLSRLEIQTLISCKALEEVSLQRLGIAQISRLVVAASEAQWHCDWLLNKMDSKHMDQIGTVDNLISVLRALATLEYRNRQLLSVMADELSKNSDALNIEQCVKVLWSFATLRERCGVVEACVERLKNPSQKNLSLLDLSPQSLVSLTWAWTRLERLEERAAKGFLKTVGNATMQFVGSFELSAFVRLIGSFCAGGLLNEAWQLYTKAQRTTLGSLSGLRGVLFHTCVQHKDVDRALTVLAHLIIFSRVAGSQTWRHALMNVAVLALLRSRGPAIAIRGHRHLAPLAGDDPIMLVLGSRLGAMPRGKALPSKDSSTKALDMLSRALRSARNDSVVDQRKEFALLRYVLGRAIPGDALSVLSAAEDFGNHISFLKMAGGAKRLLLEQVMQEAPEGVAIELGTYVGYSSIMLGLKANFTSVVTIEIDPTNAVVAKNMIEMAGLSHRVDVWIGNSGDLASTIRSVFGPDSVSFLFMDHRGSIFHDDLQAFEYHNLFKKGAKIVADNVLKPGAPRFLWDIHHRGSLNAHLVEVPEFGLGHACLEDWVAVCSYMPRPQDYNKNHPPCPETIVQLALDADAFRQRTLRGNVSINDWATHAASCKERLKSQGIQVTGYLTNEGRIRNVGV